MTSDVWQAGTVKLRRALAARPMEALCGFVLIVGGIYATSIADSSSHRTGLLVAGSAFSAFGGVLISWILARAYTRHETTHAFEDQLGNLSRNLGQAAGQIARAVNLAQAREISAETGLALISQANRMIYGQVNEIAVIRGAVFDPAYLLETASKLNAVAAELESGESVDRASLAEVRRKLETVRTGLTGGGIPRTYSEADVVCPYCDALNRVELGDVGGDTAMRVCSSCGERFNTHRAPDGSAFGRKPGPAVDRPSSSLARWSFSCPECGRTASVRAEARHKGMVCMGCLSSLLVDGVAEAVEAGPKYTRTHVEIAGRSGSRPRVACPACTRKFSAILNDGSNWLAYCEEDLQLMAVPISAWQEWDAEHPRPQVSPARTSAPMT